MKRIVIAVSGPPGAGSTTIAKNLAKKLKLEFFSPGLIQKKMSKEKSEAKAAEETWKTKEVRTKKFHENLDRIQVKKAEEGNVVICGKLSLHFLEDLADYKIWLDVPLKTRAERAAERDKISFKEAEMAISDREKMERENWKRIYGFDYFDQKKDADLVIDSTGLTPEQTTEKIIRFMKREEHEK